MNKKEFIETLIDMGGCGAKTETWDRGWDDAIGEVIGIAEELDEPETISQEWIDENKVARIDNLRKMTTSDVVTVEILKNLIVPKQDKPVIPRFVADYIELNKGWSEDRQEYIEDDSSGLWFALDGNSYGMPNSVSDWLFNEEKVETFAKAWLDGYEVEKEKRYYVRAGNSYVRFNLDGSMIGVKKGNSVVGLERLSKLPFDYKKAVESRIITLEEVTE